MSKREQIIRPWDVENLPPGGKLTPHKDVRRLLSLGMNWFFLLLFLFLGTGKASADWKSWNSSGFYLQDGDQRYELNNTYKLTPQKEYVDFYYVYSNQSIATEYDYIFATLYIVYNNGNSEQEIGTFEMGGYSYSTYWGKIYETKDYDIGGYNKAFVRRFYPSRAVLTLPNITGIRMKGSWTFSNNKMNGSKMKINRTASFNVAALGYPTGTLYRPAPNKVAFKVDNVPANTNPDNNRRNIYDFCYDNNYNSFDYCEFPVGGTSCDYTFTRNNWRWNNNRNPLTVYVLASSSADLTKSGTGITSRFDEKKGAITIPGCAYPDALSLTPNLWKKSIKLDWKNVTDGRDKSGKLYLFRYKTSEGATHRKLITTMEVSSTSYTDTYDLEYDTQYTYELSFGLTNWNITEPVSDLTTKGSITLTRSYNLALTAQPDTTSIKINCAYPAGSGTLNFSLYRKATGGEYTKLGADISRNINTSGTFSYVDKDVMNACMSYTYKVVTTAMEKDFTSNEVSASITGQTQLRGMSVSKGTYTNLVKVSWDVAQKGTASSKFILKRRVLGSTDDYANIYSTEGTSSSYYFDDITASPGQYYEYTVDCYKFCDDTYTISNSKSDNGFCQNTGIISGRIYYGTGVAVADAKVSLTTSSDIKSQFYSLHVGALGEGALWAMGSAKKALFTGKPFSVEMWVQPDDSIHQTESASSALSEPMLFNGGKTFGALLKPLTGKRGYSVVMRVPTTDGASAYQDVDTKIEVEPNAFHHLTLSTDGAGAWTMRMVSGDTLQTYNVKGLKPLTLSTDSMFFGTDLMKENTFKGYLDEIRVWTKELSDQEVLKNYNRTLSGTEKNLQLYWPLDEGIANQQYAYDYSKTGDVTNSNHGFIFGGARPADKVPTADQLSIYGLTNADGQYTIIGVPFASGGNNYTVTPTLGTHEFSPQRQTRYVNNNSLNHSGVDFQDVSSFPITGIIYYKNTDYPLDSANIYVDGQICSKDGEPVISKNGGHFTVDVPIGDHYIQVKKAGHVFSNNGRYPADPAGIGKTFTCNKANTSDIVFYDSTLVTIAGRVDGGGIEYAKPLGMGLSTNNIGKAEITLNAGGTYHLNMITVVGESGTTTSLEANSKDLAVSSPTKDVNSRAVRKGGNDELAKKIVIVTDSLTGEFAALVPPLQYMIENVKIINNQENVEFDKSNFPMLDASDTQKSYRDSTTLQNNTKKYFKYWASLNLPYYKNPNFTVTDASNDEDAFGEKSISYQDLVNPTPEDVTLYKMNAGQIEYLFKKPIFVQYNAYEFKLKGFEQYTNYDNASKPVTVTVPLSKVKVAISNEMSADQKVYVESGTDSLGNKVSAGDLTTLEDNELLLDSVGEATYKWTAGFPNIIEPYDRSMSISYTHNDKVYNWDGYNGKNSLDGIVLGALPSGTNFITSGPDKVLMILRDPPGTNSSAFWETGQTITHTDVDAGSFITNNSVSTLTKLGADATTITGTPGFGVISDIKAKYELEVGLNVNVNHTTSNSTTTTVTTTQRVSTSDQFDFVGAAGDVFIGAATNILFGNARQVAIVKNTQGDYEIKQNDVVTTGSKFATEFSFTQNYVENTLLGNLALNRNAWLTPVSKEQYDSFVNTGDSAVYLTLLDPSDEKFGSSNTDTKVWGSKANTDKTKLEGPSYKMVLPKVLNKMKIYQDKVLWYNEQIKNWIGVLANNEQVKVEAINNPSTWLDKNYSFDAGAKKDVSLQNCESKGTTYENSFESLLVGGFAFGATINGTGVLTTIKTETGGGGSFTSGDETQNCTTTGFSLAEDGDDDALTLNVFKAPDHFGAIFSTQGGQTCCPYEGQLLTKYYKPGTELAKATMQIEVPHIRVTNSPVVDVPSGKKATFHLELSNTSETKENVWFNLIVYDKSNPNGAILTLPTGPISNGHTILVNAGEVNNIDLQLAQSNTDILDYDRIGIILASQCQGDPTGVNPVIADTAWISAHFVPTSSDITLNIENRVMNMFTSDTLAMSIRDYDAHYEGLKAIRIQYKGERDVDWKLAKEYVINAADTTHTNELLPSGGIVHFSFPMSNSSLYPDQTYVFRAITARKYGSGEVTNSSAVISVIKDMARPKLLGSPKPVNGILSASDEISVVFNEPIKGSQLTDASNFIVTGVLNGATIAHDVALKAENTAQAASTEAEIQLAGKNFAADAWINYHGAGTIFSHGNGANKFTVGTDDTGHMTLNIGNASYTSVNTIPADSWVFLTFNYTNNGTSGLFSAMAAKDASTISLFNAASVPTYTGVGRLSVGLNMKGAIHELALWDRARSTSEAQGEMYKTKSPSTPYLIGYWKFNEGAGKKATDYARNRHMTLPVANWYLNNENKAVELNGTNTLALDISKCSALATDDYAYEMWFKGEKQTGEATLFSVGENTLSVAFNTAGQLTLSSKGAVTPLSTTDYLDNAWHHMALNVLRNGNAIVYVDGTVAGQTAASGIAALAGDALQIGAVRYLDNTGTYAYRNFFKGSVDEIRYWNATLSANVIRANRLVRLTGKEDGLAAYYPFEKKTLDSGSQVITVESKADASTTQSGDAQSANPIAFTNDAPALKVSPTETNINYSFVASENSIVLTLNEEPKLLEGCTINFTVRNVRDANDNLSEPVRWTAYVNQNQLTWVDNSISLKQKSLDETKFVGIITNKSGKTENWSLSNIPSWLTADLTEGSLPALTSQTVNFTVNSSTPIGKYEESIYLSGNDQIYVPFTVNLEVSGDTPNWTVDPSAYDANMNIIGQLKVVGVPSEDISDKVAAFIDGTCRGVASPVYYKRYDSYYTIMDIYGDASDIGKNITYKVWDASQGIVYPAVTTSYVVGFTPDAVTGDMANPYIWNAENMIEQDINVSKGWNWLSLYMDAKDMSVEGLFNDMKQQTDLVKGKTAFSEPTEEGWAGKLDRLYVGDMYKLKANQAATLGLTGKIVKPAEYPVKIQSGWNWIGYNASFNVSVNDAFAGLSPANGDQVKGQSGFALYQDYEWVGTLKTLAPGKGYMYLSKDYSERMFNYPSSAATGAAGAPQRTPRRLTAFRPVSETAYPGNMTMVARVMNGNTLMTNAEVGVFAGTECRGAETSDAQGLVFLTIAGEGVGTPLTFKVYKNGETKEIDQDLVYSDDATFGTVKAPYLIQFDATAVTDVAVANEVNIYPIRVQTDVNIDAPTLRLARIMIQDTGGRILYSRTNGLTQHNVVAMSAYADGIYFVVVETANGATFVKRVMK